ncbi:right-handed parallel beta-helix repeat-containing protein, partial [Reichenbachiella sp. MALMAid0571]|uniref:right-handed parallel beta-helix repeat-containing protein n=1 Tax=Reichenbachiella sp. MALMAid0571 TaxID=3143939 RepID=UPI0032DFDD52
QMFRGYKRYESAGIKFHNNANSVVSENLVTDNFTYGIWFDNKYPNARVSRNVIANNLRSGIFLEMGDYDFGTVLIDHNIIMDNVENQIYIHDASGGLFVNNLVSGTSIEKNKDEKNRSKYGQAVYIRQVGARTKTYHHAFYNNIFCGNDIIYDINYPMLRSGEQRFLGNVYDKSALQNTMKINPTSDV